ncbi:RNA helicase [Clostridium botulinum]|uniref:hypothetical protein n=1 Tax=Clostridium botulinum TaxID=1491 RepID=UPI0007740ED9|nr:hypothetical protein [Clostridium botulinum]APH23033.1 putative aTP-dependent RNA helicase HrpA [Clostridium botulinum]APQ69504.1 putative aTP-dependent RNA helicase HrpA [Clostridium botulinum]MBN3380880.1 RNA helicase [Clostridium botulinum]MBN3406207.1 RNA helicase [Clostridium botulinum]QDY17558.1 RNA helicase [Clostridium botulinum]
MAETKDLEKINCGLIMPISQIDGCSAEHWSEVKSILLEATCSISNYEFKTSLVSEADDIGVIQKRIVQNIYNSDIVICDVSGKNPNVMFELGMRLAFDKPTVIIKDNHTNYTFDTGVIEHLEYPRDLRFAKIVEFKKNLSNKLIATLKEFKNNPNHSTFLKSFGQFKIATIDEQEVTPEKAILQSIEDLKGEVYKIKNGLNRKSSSSEYPVEAIMKTKKVIDDCFDELCVTTIKDVVERTDLYSRVMNEINASRYFQDEEDFKLFYNYMLTKYVKYPLI